MEGADASSSQALAHPRPPRDLSKTETIMTFLQRQQFSFSS